MSLDRAETPVYLRGILAKKFGGGRRMLCVSSPGQAIRLLAGTVPGFEDFARNLRVKVVLKDGPIKPDALEHHTSQEIRIVPVVQGAKSDGFEFVLGAALIGLAAWNPMGWAALGTKGAWGLSMLYGMGASMMLGGAAQLLFSPPEVNMNGSKSKDSYLFNSPQNTVAQGNPVPVLHGQMIVVPPLISEGIDTEAFSTTLFSTSFDGQGSWKGNGDDEPWGASLACI